MNQLKFFLIDLIMSISINRREFICSCGAKKDEKFKLLDETAACNASKLCLMKV